jgi:drug/metabolite transporter (DMT)-like permease
MSDKEVSATAPGIAFAVSSAFAFGTLAISAKLGYREGAAPAALLALRFATAAALLLVLRLVQSRKKRTERTQIVKLLLLGGFAYALESTLFFAALENASAAVVTLVFYSFPLWTSLLAIAFRLEPFRRQLFIALGLAGAGIAIIFSSPLSGTKGPLLALGAALAVAVYFVAFQVVAKGVDPSASALWTSAGAAIGMTAVLPVVDHDLPAGAVPAGLALGLASAVAFGLLYAAIARIGSSRSAVAATMEPVATVILAAIFLGESITWRVILGAALVVSALPVLALTAPAHPEVPGP